MSHSLAGRLAQLHFHFAVIQIFNQIICIIVFANESKNEIEAWNRHMAPSFSQMSGEKSNNESIESKKRF